MSDSNQPNTDEAFDMVDAEEIDNSVELFSEDLEDRYNAKSGSSFGTASTSGSSWSSLSTFCTFA